jgi:regulator of nonsense transcripts 1
LTSTFGQTIEIVTTSKGTPSATTGRATRVSGRAATISLHGSLRGDKIQSIHTIGKEDPTSAEGRRATIILQALQRSITILQQPFVQSIWFPSETPSWPKRPWRASPLTSFTQRTLNPSQALAVKSILSDDDADRISVIQGPPGTGKTTVIAASVVSMMASANNSTMWLIAQSNVAVKNIAEKLAEVGFWNFKVLVSTGFHFDWYVLSPDFFVVV